MKSASVRSRAWEMRTRLGLYELGIVAFLWTVIHDIRAVTTDEPRCEKTEPERARTVAAANGEVGAQGMAKATGVCDRDGRDRCKSDIGDHLA